MRTDALVDALWPARRPSTAVKTVQKYVSLLRNQLHERDVLVTRADGYALMIASQAVDAGRFEHLLDTAGAVRDPSRAVVLLDEALGLWRGLPFAELGEAPAAVAERVRLEERRLEAIEALMDAQAAAPDLKSAQQQTTLVRLSIEHPNVRAAFAYSIDTADVATALAFISALAQFWDDTGYRHEGLDSIRRVLDVGPLPVSPATVTALVDASFLLQSFDLDYAHRLATIASGMAGTFGEHEQATASLALGYTFAYLDRADEAIAGLRRALGYFGEENHPWQRAIALEGLVLTTPPLDGAIEAGRDAAALFRRTGDRNRLANTLYCMASRALIADERLDEAHTWLEQSLNLSHETGNEHDRVHALLGLARLAWRRGHDAGVETLIDECLPVLERLGDQRCIGRALFVLGDLARQRDDSVAATTLLQSSIQAAERVADRVLVDSARSTLADLVV